MAGGCELLARARRRRLGAFSGRGRNQDRRAHRSPWLRSANATPRPGATSSSRNPGDVRVTWPKTISSWARHQIPGLKHTTSSSPISKSARSSIHNPSADMSVAHPSEGSSLAGVMISHGISTRWRGVQRVEERTWISMMWIVRHLPTSGQIAADSTPVVCLAVAGLVDASSEVRRSPSGFCVGHGAGVQR